MMDKHLFPMAAIPLAFLALSAAGGRAEVPPPVFSKPLFGASVAFNAANARYAYTYSLTNPAGNTVGIRQVILDLEGADLDKTRSISVPGWGGIVPGDLGGGFIARSEPIGGWSPRLPSGPLAPAGSVSGFGLESTKPPHVRQAWIFPDLADYIQAVSSEVEGRGEEFDEDAEDAIKDKYRVELSTLGPLAVTVGSFEHWDAFIADVGQAGGLGWITDPALLSGIQTNLAAARQAAVARDYATDRAKLQAVIDAIQASTAAQRTSEGYALVLLNAQALQAAIPEPVEPKLTLTPKGATYPLGAEATITATLVNLAIGEPMLAGITVSVMSGPNAELYWHGIPDPEGRFTVSYVGRWLGEDQIEASASVEPQSQFASAVVRWEGGADLTITLWSPPLLKTEPGKGFVVYEETSNVGNVAAPASETFYFMWNDQGGSLVGRREVGPLAPGEASRADELHFTVPLDLAPGMYRLAACADGGDTVAETDEANNCSDSNLLNQIAIIPAMPASNQPPVCTSAAASQSILWPPNHKLVPITITGVTDPDNDPVTIVITGITQDEPTEGLGDGDTAPDGFGVGTAEARLRAERSGLGNGRVYAISFRAEDGKGGSCTGVVRVGVPHDKKDTPVDDGQIYDSTK